MEDGLTDWRQDRALELLDDGDVTLSRGADLAGLSVRDFAALARERDVSWVGREGLEGDPESL